jgi:hypothetical protein
MAEDAARELRDLSLEDALQLVHLCAERGSPKYEPAAMRGSSGTSRSAIQGSSSSRRSRRASRNVRTESTADFGEPCSLRRELGSPMSGR